MSQRFITWISNQPESGFTRARRMIPTSFRVMPKGMGQATFRVTRKTWLNTPQTWSDVPLEGMWVKITDGTSEGPSNIKFFGFIQSVVSKKVKGEYDDEGMVVAGEIGFFLQSQPLLGHRDSAGNVLSSPPTFNPVLENKYYGNKHDAGFGENTFRISDFDKTRFGTPFSDTEKCWNRKEVIKYLGDLVDKPNLDFTFPTGWGLLDDYDLQSFPSYHGESFTKMMDDLLPEPATWWVDPTQSLSSLTITIVSKATTAIGGVGAQSTNDIDFATLPTADFTITGVEDRIDRLIYRGSKYLIGGSLSTFTAEGGDTLEKYWTTDQENAFKEGDSDNPLISQGYRQRFLKDVYTRFKFKSDDVADGCYMQRTIKPGEIHGSTQTKFAFFPLMKTQASAGSPYFAEPQAQFDVAVVPGNHATPNQMALQFVDKIPLEDRHIVNTVNYALGVTDNKVYVKPAVYLITKMADRVFWLDATANYLGSDTGQLIHHHDGLSFRLPYPEVLARDDEALFTVGSDLYPFTDSNWDGLTTDRDPNEAGGSYLTGNWQRLVFTVAAYSDQFAEVAITRQVAAVDVPVQRIKIIEDPSLQVNWVADGTVFGFQYTDTGTSILARLPSVSGGTFTRNDFPTIEKRGREAADWGFREKKSFKLETPIDGFTVPSWMKLGKMVGVVNDHKKVADPGVNYTINTTIESIEYSGLDGASPRILISSEIPELPLFKRNPSGISNDTFSGVRLEDSPPTIKRVEANIPGPTQPTLGILTTGALQKTTRIILRIKGGNVVEATAGVLGIKYSTSKITTVTSLYDAEVDTTYPDGIGRAELWIDGKFQKHVFVLNCVGYGTPVAHVLVAGYEGETWGVQEKLTLVADPTQSISVYVIRMVS